MGSNPTPCKTNFINWLQWRNRLAHGTYRQYFEKCRGCEFEPHLEHVILCLFINIVVKMFPPRPGIEPGPSTWQAEILTTRLSRNAQFNNVFKHLVKEISYTVLAKILRAGFEPATYGCLRNTTTVHRSTNWAIEGWMSMFTKSWLLMNNRTHWPWTSYLSTCVWCYICWSKSICLQHGDVAQMVERSLSMWEVGGSIPPVSKLFFST